MNTHVYHPGSIKLTTSLKGKLAKATKIKNVPTFDQITLFLGIYPKIYSPMCTKINDMRISLKHCLW